MGALNPLLGFMLAALDAGADLIEVRDESLTLIRHHYEGEGDKRKHLGSRALAVSVGALEGCDADLDGLATAITNALGEPIGALR